ERRDRADRFGAVGVDQEGPLGQHAGALVVAYARHGRPLLRRADRGDRVGRLESREALQEAARGGIVFRMAAWLLCCLLAQDRSLYVWTGAIADGKPEVGTKLLAFCAERKVARLYLMVAY